MNLSRYVTADAVLWVFQVQKVFLLNFYRIALSPWAIKHIATIILGNFSAYILKTWFLNN